MSHVTLTTEIIEAAAEAAHEAMGLDDWGVANEDERQEAIDVGIAVLNAALPIATRNLENIIAALRDDDDFDPNPIIMEYDNMVADLAKANAELDRLRADCI